MHIFSDIDRSHPRILFHFIYYLLDKQLSLLQLMFRKCREKYENTILIIIPPEHIASEENNKNRQEQQQQQLSQQNCN